MYADALLGSVRLAFLALEPMEKASGSVSDERKAKSLRARWISKPTAKKDGESGEGLFIERGTVVTMNVALARGKNAPLSVCRYRVLGVYTKYYNKWLLTVKKQAWSKGMDEKESKKFRIVARMLEAESLLQANEDVDLGGLSNYKDSTIVRLEGGNEILNVLGTIQIGGV